MNLRQRLQNATDRFLAVVLATLLAGTALAFGGAVWWAGPTIAVLVVLFALASLARVALQGRMRVLKSPLTGLGLLALGLAIAQLAPLPPALASRFSPRSHQAYTRGFLPDRSVTYDPSLPLPEAAPVRSPISVDRPATLRWVAGATACLALFWGVAQYTDRLRRLYLLWGSLLAVFFLNTAFAVVQLVGQGGGLYGFVQPGRGAAWAPSSHDLATSPNATLLRTVPGPDAAHPGWAGIVPDRPFLFGTLMGGPGAYLALAALGLPLALALVLQLLAPRGSRERLGVRLAESGQGGLLALLVAMTATASVVVGLLAGPWLSVPFAVGIVLVGLPGAWPSGVRWAGIGLTVLALCGLGGGAAAGEILRTMPGALPPGTPEGLGAATRVWSDARAIAHDFPLFGSGLGSFATVYPFYKTSDESRTTALSSLLQWWVESGAVGLALLLIGATWCLWRLPGAVRRVGTADRALAFGLIGAAAGFSLYAAVHWTVELAAVAIVVSALGGACNRWLAGGTDLFVERG